MERALLLARARKDVRGLVDLVGRVVEMRRKPQSACAQRHVNAGLRELFGNASLVSVTVRMTDHDNRGARGRLSRRDELPWSAVQPIEQTLHERGVVRGDPLDALLEEVFNGGCPRLEVEEVGRAEHVVGACAKSSAGTLF